MRPGAALGVVVCVALTSCAGAAMAAVGGLVALPPALVALDIAFGSNRDAPPFHWLKPMSWLLPLLAGLGACVGGWLAARRIRAAHGAALRRDGWHEAASPDGTR